MWSSGEVLDAVDDSTQSHIQRCPSRINCRKPEGSRSTDKEKDPNPSKIRNKETYLQEGEKEKQDI